MGICFGCTAEPELPPQEWQAWLLPSQLLRLGLVHHSAGPKSLDFMDRYWHWLEIIHQFRQVSAGLIDGRSEGRGLFEEQLACRCAV